MKLVLLAALFSLIGGCSDDGLLPFDEYENVDVEVWFYFEANKKDYFLGTVRGASACGRVARNYARAKKVEKTKWSYICMTTDGTHQINGVKRYLMEALGILDFFSA